jgi:predicted transcriptional regulator
MYPRLQPLKAYAPSDLENAIIAVLNGAKVNDAARKFNIPKSTLYEKLQRRKRQLMKINKKSFVIHFP